MTENRGEKTAIFETGNQEHSLVGWGGSACWSCGRGEHEGRGGSLETWAEGGSFPVPHTYPWAAWAKEPDGYPQGHKQKTRLLSYTSRGHLGRKRKSTWVLADQVEPPPFSPPHLLPEHNRPHSRSRDWHARNARVLCFPIIFQNGFIFMDYLACAKW